MTATTKTTAKVVAAKPAAKRAPAKAAVKPAAKKVVAAKATPAKKAAPAKTPVAAKTPARRKADKSQESVLMAVNLTNGHITDSAVMSITDGQPARTAAQLLEGAAKTVSPEVATASAPSMRQQRRAARSELRAANKAAAKEAGLRPIRRDTKRAAVFEMLAQPTGATLDEIVAKTEEGVDTVRTVLTKNVKGKGYEIMKEVDDKRGEVMFLAHAGKKIAADQILYAAKVEAPVAA